MASSSDQDVASCNAESTNETEGPEEIFPGYSSVSDFSQQALRTVVQATKTSNDLPTGDDYDYYSTYDSVRNVMDMEARRILQLLQNVMRHQNVKGMITGTDHALELDEQFDVIIDANDQILERVGTSVDEATGVKKSEHTLVVAAVNRPNPAVASWNKKAGKGSPSVPVQLLTARNIQRPQLSFKDKIDNSNKPFVPILVHKPHAIQSLRDSLQLPEHITLEDTEGPDFVYPHPYKLELDQWQPSGQQLERVTPQVVQSVDACPPDFIDTAADLAELCDLLKNEKEIAVDLEHHSFRTFQGFTCLMQISTRSKDYLVDTLALRSDMSILNEVFTDPKITKVFHGADSDVEWLQRDFGLYVVNMFDTGQAARVLNHARFSLAHLLQTYCQVEADKQFQLSDWRMRPLHDKLVRYAQEDTHYLLHIYDRMRAELLDRGNEQKNLLQSVYMRSKQVCLRVYRRARFTPESHLELFNKSKKVFDAQQRQALKAIFAWRDHLARDEDESIQYVLPNHMLLQIAEILPRERQGVLACCNPIPPLVRQCQHEIHSIIMDAREISLLQAQIDDKKRRQQEPTSLQHPQYHDTISTCHHDLSKQSQRHQGDMEVDSDTDGIPRKPSSSLFSSLPPIVLKKRPILSALTAQGSSDKAHRGTKTALVIRRQFCDPFVKFLSAEARTEGDTLLKPQTTAKSGMTWRLKMGTGIAGNKRKSDVDLNTFTPEFAPPAKSKRTDATATSEPIASAAAPASTSASTPEAAATAKKEKKKRKGKKAVEEEEEEEEEENPLSMRQMMKLKKKEKKAKKLAFITDSPVPSPEPDAVDDTPEPTEEKKKKKKNLKAASQELLSPETNNLLADASEEKKKKKKKKKKLNASLVTEAEVAAEDKEEEEGTEKKKKKKKKKAVTTGEEAEVEEVTPFDYSAEDKSSLTGAGKKKHYPDVYNPHFRGGDKNKKKGNKKRFGAKQRQSMSFKSGSRGGKT